MSYQTRNNTHPLTRLLYVLLLCCCSCLPLTATAHNHNEQNNNIDHRATPYHRPNTYKNPNTILVTTLCPPVKSLMRSPSTQYWAAPGGWQSPNMSFLTTLDTFVGAQWVGVNVGHIICIYAETKRHTFPVTLQQHQLIPVPKVGGLWSANKGGYEECVSHNPHDCPFSVEVHKPIKDVYKQLDFFHQINNHHSSPH